MAYLNGKAGTINEVEVRDAAKKKYVWKLKMDEMSLGEKGIVTINFPDFLVPCLASDGNDYVPDMPRAQVQKFLSAHPDDVLAVENDHLVECRKVVGARMIVDGFPSLDSKAKLNGHQGIVVACKDIGRNISPAKYVWTLQMDDPSLGNAPEDQGRVEISDPQYLMPFIPEVVAENVPTADAIIQHNIAISPLGIVFFPVSHGVFELADIKKDESMQKVTAIEGIVRFDNKTGLVTPWALLSDYFPAVTSIGGLQVSHAPASILNVQNIKTITGDVGMYIASPNLTMVYFPALEKVVGEMVIKSDSLKVLSLSNLNDVGTLVIDCPNLRSLDLGNLISVRGSLTIRANASLLEVSLPKLTEVNGALTIKCLNRQKRNDLSDASDEYFLRLYQHDLPDPDKFLESTQRNKFLDLNSLRSVHGPLTIRSKSLREISSPELVNVLGDFYISCPELQISLLDRLEEVQGDFSIEFRNLNHLDLRSLHTVQNSFLLQGETIGKFYLPDGSTYRLFPIASLAWFAHEQSFSADALSRFLGFQATSFAMLPALSQSGPFFDFRGPTTITDGYVTLKNTSDGINFLPSENYTFTSKLTDFCHLARFEKHRRINKIEGPVNLGEWTRDSEGHLIKYSSNFSFVRFFFSLYFPAVNTIGKFRFVNWTTQYLEMSRVQIITGDVYIQSGKLETLIFSSLEAIHGSLTIQCSEMESLNLSRLRRVDGPIEIRSKSLISIELPKLFEVKGSLVIVCPNLKSINLNSFKTQDLESVRVTEEPTNNIPSGDNASYDNHFISIQSRSLQNLQLPKLRGARELTVESHSIKTLKLPNLLRVDRDVTIKSISVKEVALPKLKKVHGSFSLEFFEMDSLCIQLCQIDQRFILHGSDIKRIDAYGSYRDFVSDQRIHLTAGLGKNQKRFLLESMSDMSILEACSKSAGIGNVHEISIGPEYRDRTLANSQRNMAVSWPTSEIRFEDEKCKYPVAKCHHVDDSGHRMELPLYAEESDDVFTCSNPACKKTFSRTLPHYSSRAIGHNCQRDICLECGEKKTNFNTNIKIGHFDVTFEKSRDFEETILSFDDIQELPTPRFVHSIGGEICIDQFLSDTTNRQQITSMVLPSKIQSERIQEYIRQNLDFSVNNQDEKLPKSKPTTFQFSKYFPAVKTIGGLHMKQTIEEVDMSAIQLVKGDVSIDSPKLKDFDLSGLQKVEGDLSIHATRLKKVFLPHLQEVGGSVVISKRPEAPREHESSASESNVQQKLVAFGKSKKKVTSLILQDGGLDLKQLRRVTGKLEIQAANISELQLPALEEVGGILIDCSSAQSVDLPNLTRVAGPVVIIGSKSLEKISLPRLATIDGSVTIDCPQLKELDLKSLSEFGGGLKMGTCDSNVPGDVCIKSPDLDILRLNALKRVVGSIFIEVPKITLIELDALSTVSRDVHISTKSKFFRKLRFSELSEVGGVFSLIFNHRIQHLHLGKLEKVAEKIALSGHSIDSISVPGTLLLPIDLKTFAAWAEFCPEMFPHILGIQVPAISIVVATAKASSAPSAFQRPIGLSSLWKADGILPQITNHSEQTFQENFRNGNFLEALSFLQQKHFIRAGTKDLHAIEKELETILSGESFDVSGWVSGPFEKDLIGSVKSIQMETKKGFYEYVVELQNADGTRVDEVPVKPEQLHSLPIDDRVMIGKAPSRISQHQFGTVKHWNGSKFTVEFDNGTKGSFLPEELIFKGSTVLFGNQLGKVQSFDEDKNAVRVKAEGSDEDSVDLEKVEKASPYRDHFQNEPADLARPKFSVNRRDFRGRTLLHYTAMNDDLSPFTIALLNAGASYDIFDNAGHTPLHYAAMTSSVNAGILLRYGDDPSRKSAVTAWQYAALLDREDILEQLYWQICELDNRERRFFEWEQMFRAVLASCRQQIQQNTMPSLSIDGQDWVDERLPSIEIICSDGTYNFFYDKSPKLWDHIKKQILDAKKLDLITNRRMPPILAAAEAKTHYSIEYEDLTLDQVKSTIAVFSKQISKGDDDLSIFEGISVPDLASLHESGRQFNLPDLCRNLRKPDLCQQTITIVAQKVEEANGQPVKPEQIDQLLTQQMGQQPPNFKFQTDFVNGVTAALNGQ